MFSVQKAVIVSDAYIKKKQSRMKALVKQFTKQIAIWKLISSENSQLFLKLQSLYFEYCSISRCSDYPLYRNMFSNHPSLNARLRNALVKETEIISVQIVKCLRSFGDIIAAMQLTGSDCMKELYDENPNALCISEGSLTFTVDHMLEIHQLNSQFVNHYYTMRQVFAPLWRWCPSTPSQQNHVHPDAGFLELAVLEKIDEWLQLPTTLDITEDAQTQKMEIIDMDRGV